MTSKSVFSIRLVILAIGALAFRAEAGTPIRKAPAITGIPIADSTPDQTRPRIAFESRSDRALVVWEDETLSGAFGIYGRILLGDGTPTGSPFLISTLGANSHTVPMVVASDARTEFLVVWQYAFSPTDMDIYARLVNSNGVLISDMLPVATSGAIETNPSVTYNANMDRYLVAFEFRPGPDLFAPPDVAVAPVAGNGRSWGPTSLLFGGTPAFDFSPRVAYSPLSHAYVVVFAMGLQDAVNLQPYSVGLDENGIPVGQPHKLIYAENIGYKPDIVWNSLMNSFMAAWEFHFLQGSSPRSLIQGTLMRSDGTVYYGPLDVVGSLPGDCTRPSLTCSSLTGEFLAAFEYEYSQSDHDVLAQRVDRLGGRPEPPIAISSALAWESGPAVASNGVVRYFAVWEDGRNPATAFDIYGGILDTPVFAGLVYDGQFGDVSLPLKDAWLSLQGLTGAWPDTAAAVYLTSATTNDEGSYTLPVYGSYPYYVIKAIPPPGSGYQAVGAMSQQGIVLASNMIQHTGPITPTLHQGDAFWMLVPSSVMTPPGTDGPLRVIDSWPNPTTGSCRLQLGGRGAEACRVQVFDSAGRLVRLIVPDDHGSSVIEWDGRLSEGAPAPNGTYFLRVVGGGSDVGRKVTILR